MSENPTDLGMMSRIEGLLAAIGPVEGLEIIDVGCGEGEMARALAERGATVRGYDPFIAGTDWTAQGTGSYRLSKATADAIPEPDASADLVLFVFSLHHVPEPTHAAAMAEARRLLRPSGRLCVAEPLAEGPNQYLMEPYHDETAVRRAATEALEAYAAPLFGREQVVRFSEGRTLASFDEFTARAFAGMRFNGYTEADILQPEVRRRFDEVMATHGGRLEQPVRVNIFAA
jgi:2-polyprenyl-3-methyl-5-hydroxy-6-metoxy-1,4-benzoquinol methylase